MLQIPLHLIHNIHSCSLFLKVLKKTKTLFPRARGSTCYQPGRRAQTERSSSDQDLPATSQLVPKICRHPPTGQLVPLRLITADSSPVQHFRLVFQRGKAAGRENGQELDWMARSCTTLRLFCMCFPINIILLDQAMNMWI